MTGYSESKDGSNKGSELIRKSNLAFNSTERTNVETLWYELANYILPSQNGNFFGDQTKGQAKDWHVYDNTAPLMCRDMASSLHATVSNPSSKWSKLRFQEEALNNSSTANAWTSNATNIIHNYFNDSNFDNQIGRCYLGYCGLGTMVLMHDELYDESTGAFKGFSFSAWHLSEVAYAENYQGVVDEVYRKFKLTIKQAYEKFGDEIGEDLLERLKTRPLEEIELRHCIYKRDPKEVKVNSMGYAPPEKRPIASDYILMKGNKIVKSDGYYEFPVYVARWLTLPGEIYGYGPGHVARPDALTLNSITRQILKGLAKAIDPIIFQNQNNLLSGDMRPGKIVSVNDVTGIKEMVTQSRFDVGFLEAKELKESIKSAFYIDKLQLPPRTETGEMTAYEIRQRMAQNQLILGPPLSRLNTEVFQPLIMRSLKILMRNNIIPPLPDEVIQQSQGKVTGTNKTIDLDIAFVNALARSQQQEEISNITSWVQETAGIAQMGKPEALDLINVDQVIESIARLRDIPEELVVNDEELQAVRDQRQQQMQQQNALQAGESIGNIAKNVSGLQQGGGNVQQ